MSRDDIRTAILSAKPKKKVIELFGQKIEIRQPQVKDILSIQESDSNLDRFFKVMLQYCYVPNTNEKVFEDADRDALAAVPFGPEFDALNLAISELIDIDVTGQEGNLKGTP